MTDARSIPFMNATTDLARAHAIAALLKDTKNTKESMVTLEGALVASYSLPFVRKGDLTQTIDLAKLPLDATSEELVLHKSLLDLANRKLAKIQNSSGKDGLIGEQLLEGLDLKAVIDWIFKLRRTITLELYPDLADDPDALSLMIGPFERRDHSKSA